MHGEMKTLKFLKLKLSCFYNLQVDDVTTLDFIHTLQIPDSHYEKKKTQNEHMIAHFGYFFTCHYSKTCLAR